MSLKSIGVEFYLLQVTLDNIFIQLISFVGTSKFLNVRVRTAHVRACFGLVVLIVSKAQPTEIMLATTTSHVHAASILIYRSFTLWTRLCI
jgi:hypothetical protein